jgi:hypothetical protein
LTNFTIVFTVFRIVLPAIIFLYLCTFYYSAVWLIDYLTAKEYIKLRVCTGILTSGSGLPGKWQGLSTPNLQIIQKYPCNFAV